MRDVSRRGHARDAGGAAAGGRQPGDLARQLYDFQKGTRNGAMAGLMKPSVEKLTDDDLISLSAYLASLRP